MSRSDVHGTVNDRPDDALDAAIDRALREMTALDPPQRLTSTVMARIEGRTGGRAGTSRSWWPLAAALAAAVLVALAVAVTIVSRGRFERGTLQTAAPVSPAGAVAPLTAQASGPMTAPEAETHDAGKRTSGSGRVPTEGARAHDPAAPSTTVGLEPAIAIGPIPRPAPIAIVDIAPRAVVLAPLGGIEEIDIEPLQMDEVVKR